MFLIKQEFIKYLLFFFCKRISEFGLARFDEGCEISKIYSINVVFKMEANIFDSTGKLEKKG